MTGLEYLAAGYAGDEAWETFVDASRPSWATFAEKELLISKVQDEDLAIVLASLIGANAINWLDVQVPALTHWSPIEVLTRHPDGINIIRALLMRMPS
jgi:hypothetical protein